MSLRTGTELITLSLLLNKVSGFYGLLAILTGLHLSPLQLSMYIYSLLALFIIAMLAPHIRSQSPFPCLALAWFYVLDSIINAAYTAAFGITWFRVISQHHSDKSGEAPIPGAGGSTMGDTAGFTSPKYNVSAVEVAASPAAGLTDGQDAVAVGIPADGSATYSGSPSLKHGVLQPESMSSVIVIVALWAVRVYFILIVLSYARFVLRQYIATVSRSNVQLHTGSADGNLAENPFASHMPEGQGWKGRLGRMMVRLGRGYWLGSEEEDAWMISGSGKFRRLASKEPHVPGVVERERRRRSGTGPPPPPPPQLQGQQGQHLRVQELQEIR